LTHSFETEAPEAAYRNGLASIRAGEYFAAQQVSSVLGRLDLP
jgi:hypothetical protein